MQRRLDPTDPDYRPPAPPAEPEGEPWPDYRDPGPKHYQPPREP